MPPSATLLQAAKHGDPTAIAVLMNQALARREIRVWAQVQARCLILVFHLPKPLPPESLIRFTRNSFMQLGQGVAHTIDVVQVYQQLAGAPPRRVKGFRLHPGKPAPPAIAPIAGTPPSLIAGITAGIAHLRTDSIRLCRYPWRFQRYLVASVAIMAVAGGAITLKSRTPRLYGKPTPSKADGKLTDDGMQVPAPGEPIPPLNIFGDTNRDGQVDKQDVTHRQSFSFPVAGAFFLANVDDDNGDGQPDALDRTVNGTADQADLAPLRIRLKPGAIAPTDRIYLQLWPSNPNLQTKVNVFERTATGWHPVDLSGKTPLHSTLTDMTLAIEAQEFASASWNGIVTLKAEVRAPQGKSIGYDLVALRVAPWIMLPNSARTEAVYVATGQYDNANFQGELAAIVTALKLPPPRTVPVRQWQQAWTQDMMEIGYTQLPGQPPMHVILQAHQHAGASARSLLAPNLGYISVGTYRGLVGGDQWADWSGNLEVSHPTPSYPLGRIYYGLNVNTGIGFQPAVVRFLKAQAVQAPIWLDTSWLNIKHVDEILNFLPGVQARGVMMVVSPAAAAPLTPGYDAYNRLIQARLDKLLKGGTYPLRGDPVYFESLIKQSGQVVHPGAIAAFELNQEQILPLPNLYQDGYSQWSSPVNSVYVNGVVIAGKTDIPQAVQHHLTHQWHNQKAKVSWIDDSVYQLNSGNVHCATNTLRTPIVGQYWETLASWPYGATDTPFSSTVSSTNGTPP